MIHFTQKQLNPHDGNVYKAHSFGEVVKRTKNGQWVRIKTCKCGKKDEFKYIWVSDKNVISNEKVEQKNALFPDGFPNKWAIQRTPENAKELNEYINRGKPVSRQHRLNKGFFICDDLGIRLYHNNKGYPIITLEQFREITRQDGEIGKRTKKM